VRLVRRVGEREGWVLPALVAVIVWIAVFGAGYGLLSLLRSPSWSQQAALRSRGRRVSARVIFISADHRQCQFFYPVGAQQLLGTDICDAVRTGQTITVTYLPNDPTVVVAGKPTSSGKSEDVLLLVIAATGFALGFARAAVLARRWLRRAAQRSSTTT
jgi:hypothetical protein